MTMYVLVLRTILVSLIQKRMLISNSNTRSWWMFHVRCKPFPSARLYCQNTQFAIRIKIIFNQKSERHYCANTLYLFDNKNHISSIPIAYANNGVLLADKRREKQIWFRANQRFWGAFLYEFWTRKMLFQRFKTGIYLCMDSLYFMMRWWWWILQAATTAKHTVSVITFIYTTLPVRFDSIVLCCQLSGFLCLGCFTPFQV